MPRLPTRLYDRSCAAASCGAGLTNGESDDGGFDELVESIPNRRFSSAFSASNTATRCAKLGDHPRLLDDQGGKLVIRRTPIPGLHPMIIPPETIKPHRRPDQLHHRYPAGLVRRRR